MTARHRASGVTLLELTVVLAIFALISVMALQALRGAIRSEARLEAHAGETADLARVLTRLRHDLQAAVPLAFTDPQGGDRAALVVSPGGAGFALSLGGQASLGGASEAPGLRRVEWLFDRAEGRLARRVWLTLSPARTARPGPAIVQMDGIDSVAVTVFGPGGTWQATWPPNTDVGPTTLPRALRVRIESRRHGRLDVIERF